MRFAAALLVLMVIAAGCSSEPTGDEIEGRVTSATGFTVLEVFVNGRSAGVVMWPPFEADVTDLLKSGENEIAVKVVSSRKNLLGPLHHTAKKLSWTGAAQFRTEGDQWTDGYNFVPYGISGRVAVEWRG